VHTPASKPRGSVGGERARWRIAWQAGNDWRNEEGSCRLQETGENTEHRAPNTMLSPTLSMQANVTAMGSTCHEIYPVQSPPDPADSRL
jgi:hypothetical protein